MTTSPPLAGSVDPAFASVRDVFEGLLRSGDERGAALAVIHDRRLVVDLRGGWTAPDRTRAFQPDTLVSPFSVSKPVAALGLLLLIERGQVRLDDPVSRHWPEFGAVGKDQATIQHLLAHQAGVPAFPRPVPTEAIGDWSRLVADLAAAAPQWTPGTAHGEHALTYGHLVGEVVRRVDGRNLGRLLREEIAAPLGLDLHLGLDEAARSRCADVEYADPSWPSDALGEPGSLWARALGNPPGCLDAAVLNSHLWRTAEMPAVNIHGTAVAYARWYDGLATGSTPLLGAELRASLVTPVTEGPDLVLGRPVRWGLGVQVEPSGEWGMGGAGGSSAYVHPGLDYAFAYLTRTLGDHSRVDALATAVESCLS